jgi:flagellar biosynthesis protein FlhG
MRVVSITSGKGGVGKTLTSVQFAMAAQQLGYRVLLVDGDFSLANVDIVLGLNPRYNINDVISDNKSIDAVLVEGPFGLTVLPSGSGLGELTKLSYLKRAAFFEGLLSLRRKFDLCVFDTGAGISDTVMHLNRLADDVLIVTTSDPQAITDAYAINKLLNMDQKNCHLVVNMVHSDMEGQFVAARLNHVLTKYTGKATPVLGVLPFEEGIQDLVRRKKMDQFHLTGLGQKISNMCQNILARNTEKRDQDHIWNQLFFGQTELQEVI